MEASEPTRPVRSVNGPHPIPSASISLTHFTAVTLDGLDLEATTEHYLDWIEGRGAYGRRRNARADQGVPSPLDRRRLIAGATITGDKGCEVSARSAPGQVLLRFIHRDDKNPEVCWYSVMRLQREPGDVPAVLVEHATGRTVPPHLRLDPVAGAPVVLRKLCELPRVRPRSRDLVQQEVVRLNPGEADHFVRYVLLDEDRSHPYLIVSAETDTGTFVVEPETLAHRLATQVAVATLHQDATREFAVAFERAGFDHQFGVCFDGAARLYHLGVDPSRDFHEHYLWLPDRLRDYGLRGTDRLAGEVAERVAWRALPPRFFSLLEDWDRNESRARAEATLRQRVVESDDMVVKFRDQQQEIADLRAQLGVAQKDRDFWEKEVENYEDTVKDLRRRLDSAEQERDEERQKASRLSAHLEKLRARNATLSEEQHAALRSVLRGEVGSLSDALHILEALYSDRVVILPSAWESAEESASFRKVDKAWELMLILVEDYWAKVQEGGDAEARQVFPRVAYAARESETVESRKGARWLRTFDYNGARVTMFKHLKIGVKDNVTDTFRLHFEFDAERKRVVIGHCGKHLDF